MYFGLHRNSGLLVLLLLGSFLFSEVSQARRGRVEELPKELLKLSKAIQHADPAKRKSAIWSLSHKGKMAIPILLRAIKSSLRDVRIEATLALGEQEDLAPFVYQTLLTQLKHPDISLRHATMLSLTLSGKQAIPSLRKSLAGLSSVRIYVVDILGRMGVIAQPALPQLYKMYKQLETLKKPSHTTFKPTTRKAFVRRATSRKAKKRTSRPSFIRKKRRYDSKHFALQASILLAILRIETQKKKLVVIVKKGLQSTSWLVRFTAIEGLRHTQVDVSALFFSRLEKAAKSPEPIVRSSALRVLCDHPGFWKIIQKSSLQRSDWLTTMKHGDTETFRCAIRALGYFRSHDSKTLKTLLKLLEKGGKSGALAFQTLRRIGKPVLPLLKPYLKRLDAPVGRKVVDLLWKMKAKGTSFVPELLKGCANPKLEYRRRAAKALAGIGRKAAVSIHAWMSQHTSKMESIQHLCLLEALFDMGPAAAPAAKSAALYLGRKVSPWRGLALRTLRRMGDKVFPVLVKRYPKASKDEKRLIFYWLRRRALSKKSRKLLLLYKKHPQKWIRRKAKQLLKKIGELKGSNTSKKGIIPLGKNVVTMTAAQKKQLLILLGGKSKPVLRQLSPASKNLPPQLIKTNGTVKVRGSVTKGKKTIRKAALKRRLPSEKPVVVGLDGALSFVWPILVRKVTHPQNGSERRMAFRWLGKVKGRQLGWMRQVVGFHVPVTQKHQLKALLYAKLSLGAWNKRRVLFTRFAKMNSKNKNATTSLRDEKLFFHMLFRLIGSHDWSVRKSTSPLGILTHFNNVNDKLSWYGLKDFGEDEYAQARSMTFWQVALAYSTFTTYKLREGLRILDILYDGKSPKNDRKEDHDGRPDDLISELSYTAIYGQLSYLPKMAFAFKGLFGAKLHKRLWVIKTLDDNQVFVFYNGKALKKAFLQLYRRPHETLMGIRAQKAYDVLLKRYFQRLMKNLAHILRQKAKLKKAVKLYAKNFGTKDFSGSDFQNDQADKFKTTSYRLLGMVMRRTIDGTLPVLLELLGMLLRDYDLGLYRKYIHLFERPKQRKNIGKVLKVKGQLLYVNRGSRSGVFQGQSVRVQMRVGAKSTKNDIKGMVWSVMPNTSKVFVVVPRASSRVGQLVTFVGERADVKSWLGHCPESDKKLCLLWKACRKGRAKDCLRLAETYHEGKSVLRDWIRARMFSLRACSLGSGKGCGYLGSLWYRGLGGVKDLRKAGYFLKKGCKLKSTRSCSSLGWLFQNGFGVKEDKAKAHFLYQKACSLGEKDSCFLLGRQFHKGIGIPKDHKKARHFLRKACSLGHFVSCNDLAIMLETKQGGKKEVTEARKLYHRACRHKIPIACENLGDLYKSGLSVGKSCVRARVLYQKACFLSGNKLCQATCF